MPVWVSISISAISVLTILSSIALFMYSRRVGRSVYLAMSETCRLMAETAELQGRHEDASGHRVTEAEFARWPTRAAIPQAGDSVRYHSLSCCCTGASGVVQ